MKLIKLKSLVIAALLLMLSTFNLPASASAEKLADVNLILSTNQCVQCDLSNVDFSGQNLSSTNLSSADLSRANLSRGDLSRANLSKADLTHANLQSTQLQKANFKNSNLSDADLSQASLNGADLSNAYLVNANFSGANLTEARFCGFFGGAANLKLVNFSAANLQGAILRDTNLVNANLSRANLSKGTDLRGAKLDGSDLSSADLSGANLRDASLTYVNLQNAKLNSADLSRVNLTGSDMSGVDFTDIKLTNATLDEAIGLDPYAEQLLQKAQNQAASGKFLTAISYLEVIPIQTKVYKEAQTKIAQYTELQKEAEAEQTLQDAENAAATDNFDTAISYLRKVPVDTEAYSKAQDKIAEYTEKQHSIGVTRNAIQSVFEQPEFGFSFEPGTPIDGQPNIVGRGGNTIIELVGPQNNLSSATIILVAPNEPNPLASVLLASYSLKFIKTASPNWENNGEWLSSNLDHIVRGIQSEANTTRGNQQISLHVSRELGSIVLNVKAKQQG